MLYRLQISLIVFLFAGCRAFAQLPPSNAEYHLVFQDEFETTYPITSVDSKEWNRTPAWNQSTNLTMDVSWCFPTEKAPIYWDQAYVMRDAGDSTTLKVSNGTCKLIANKGRHMGRVSNWPPCDPKHPGYAIGGSKCQDECQIRGTDTIATCRTNDTLEFKYTTGKILSKRKFKYGYFEIRFRLPKNPDPPFTYQGFGPNFWLWGNNPPENKSSELDIFEIIAFNPVKSDSNKYTCAVHYSGNPSDRNHTAKTEVLGNFLKNDTAWHKASAWWTNEFINFYFDDSLFFTVRGNPEIPVDKLAEMSMIVDVNAPVPGRCNNFDGKHTSFPYVYEVDYVRVYQMK